jgi:hypothetical protein
MTSKFAASAVLAMLLPATFAVAQTVAEQLQKAIYNQETVGDVDSAIQMYRQIISSNTNQRTVAAQAQFRLAQALLQKGDLNGASQEFQTLALNYSDYRGLIMSMSARLRSGTHGPSITVGSIENNRYHHKLTGLEFDTPSGWTITGDGGSSGGGEMVILAEPKTKAFAAVWLKPVPDATADIPATLRQDLERKHEDRSDKEGWTIRPGSVQTRIVGGQQALTAIADFKEGREAMVEYLTWARSTKNKAFFFGQVRAADFPVLQAALEQAMATALIP